MPKFLIKPSTNRQLSCLHFLGTMNTSETNKGVLMFLILISNFLVMYIVRELQDGVIILLLRQIFAHIRVEAMAHLVRHLLYKHENVSLYAQNSYKGLGTVVKT